MGGTRPGGRPASAVPWRREASTDHSHEGGADTVDAFPFTLQDLTWPSPARRHDLRTSQRPKLRNTRAAWASVCEPSVLLTPPDPRVIKALLARLTVVERCDVD